MNPLFLLLAITLFITIAALVFVVIWFRHLKDKNRVARALNMSLFLVTLPKKVKKETTEAKTQKETIAVMEQLYASLSNLKAKSGTLLYEKAYLVFEIATPEEGEEICFYLAVPKSYEDIIEKQIHGFFPHAAVERTEDYNIFNPEGKVAGAYVKLKKTYALPLKTYQNLEADPLNEITNTLSKLAVKGEGAAVQIAFRPAASSWQKLGLKIASEMQKGKNFNEAKTEASKGTTSKIAQDFIKSSKPKKEGELPQREETKPITPGQEEIIKALESKAAKAGFEANLRLIVSADDKERAEQILAHLESAFVQFNAPNLNSLDVKRVAGAGLKKFIYQFSFRMFNPRQISVLNTEELTSLYHFPNAIIETPKVKYLKAEPAPPPINLPKDGIIIGRSLYRGQEAVIRMLPDDRRRHLYIIGQTGTGKSALMKNMVAQDICKGHGVCLIDPHGDSAEAVLGMVPKPRAEDVIWLDPADLQRPIGLNMLEYNPAYPEQKTFAVNELINIFDKLYDLKTTGGPMFEQYTRNALLLLMDDPAEKFTLMEVPRVLADKEFRSRLLQKCQNIVVKDFWQKEAEKAGGESSLQNIVPYITSKFNVFIANDYMRPIIGQAQSTINFRQIMDEKKILLVNLSKGRLGDINSALLGLIVTGKLLMAAFSRVDMPEFERNDFYLYMDEFQNFTTDSIATILSEARKYRLCLNIAHQYIGQLKENIRDAIFGNVGSMITFRIGAEDAESMVKQFEPVFDQNDLINVDNFNAYVKLMISNVTSQPFSMLAYPPLETDQEMMKSIGELSRLKYGREKQQVEREIIQRSRFDQPVGGEAFIDSEIR
jgi:hypothetical protein